MVEARRATSKTVYCESTSRRFRHSRKTSIYHSPAETYPSQSIALEIVLEISEEIMVIAKCRHNVVGGVSHRIDDGPASPIKCLSHYNHRSRFSVQHRRPRRLRRLPSTATPKIPPIFSKIINIRKQIPDAIWAASGIEQRAVIAGTE
jgi:hypothetical protein